MWTEVIIPDLKTSGITLVLRISLKTVAIAASRTVPEYFKCSAVRPISSADFPEFREPHFQRLQEDYLVRYWQVLPSNPSDVATSPGNSDQSLDGISGLQDLQNRLQMLYIGGQVFFVD